MIVDEDYVEHYGTKGMRWGVRRQRRLDRITRVAKGKGSFNDKVSAVGQLSVSEILRDKGSLKAASLRKANQQEATKSRILSGEAKTRDLMNHLGSQRLEDFIPVRRSKR